MKRKKIIIVLLLVLVLFFLTAGIVYMIFKRNGYLYYYSIEDEFKVKYEYDEKNRTISYGNRKMKIVAFNPDYPYLIVDIDRGIDNAGGYESDNKVFRTIIKGNSKFGKKSDYSFVIRKDGSFEGV